MFSPLVQFKILKMWSSQRLKTTQTERMGGARGERVLVKIENGVTGGEMSRVKTADTVGVSTSHSTSASQMEYDALSSRMGSIDELRTAKL